MNEFILSTGQESFESFKRSEYKFSTSDHSTSTFTFTSLESLSVAIDLGGMTIPAQKNMFKTKLDEDQVEIQLMNTSASFITHFNGKFTYIFSNQIAEIKQALTQCSGTKPENKDKHQRNVKKNNNEVVHNEVSLNDREDNLIIQKRESSANRKQQQDTHITHELKTTLQKKQYSQDKTPVIESPVQVAIISIDAPKYKERKPKKQLIKEQPKQIDPIEKFQLPAEFVLTVSEVEFLEIQRLLDNCSNLAGASNFFKIPVTKLKQYEVLSQMTLNDRLEKFGFEKELAQ
ncbi:hypothetical protein SS50377_20761 [Spironucleus salmonicida]|uniref:Uncharacterized protein n=1 Tax=Spironucleus salmonicida TaxID=348837 RepID=V6LR95_9EUKA|nr:hypothetical protein SS50377_20761 [Spironucleus salmonicida]|eukprot:EST47130.1 Hypothetical protein SS50377_12838 [Spironucleus salmonicida]